MQKKFSKAQMATLRNELLELGVDSLQVAEMIKGYLAALGYGISAETAQEIAIRLECNHEDAEAFGRELETFAMTM